MDALTDTIWLLRPQTVVLGVLSACGEWGVRVPAQPGPSFYFVTEGDCWFQGEQGEPVRLQKGDYVLSARPFADTFRSTPGIETELSDDAFKARYTVDGEVRIGDPSEGPLTRILGGLIVCDAANKDLLVDLLPRSIFVYAAEGGEGRFSTLLALIQDEASEPQPGRDAVLARLIEVMLIETLRRQAEASLPNGGLLGGLADPQLARALAEIHADVGRGWTVGELARRAGMSRAAFARRFSEAVGAAPVEYLLNWRMALAKDALRNGHDTLEEIAAAVGYKSASAFSTAFSQRVGHPPSEYAASSRARTLR